MFRCICFTRSIIDVTDCGMHNGKKSYCKTCMECTTLKKSLFAHLKCANRDNFVS